MEGENQAQQGQQAVQQGPTQQQQQGQQQPAQQAQQGQQAAQQTQQQQAPAVDPVIAQRLARLAELEAAEVQRQTEARQAEAQRLVQSGRAEEVARHYQTELETERQRYSELMSRTRNAERDRVLTGALAGRQLSYPEAAQDLLRLWADDFEVADGPNGGFVVRDRASMRPASEVIAERLGQPRWAGFLAPTSRGGDGARPAGAAPTLLPNGQAPRNLGEVIMAQFQARQGQPPSGVRMGVGLIGPRPQSN